MRLLDLHPRWAVDSKLIGRHGMGLTFECPHCQEIRVAVFFKNPLDGKEPAKTDMLWDRDGETFRLLSLTPAIDIPGHWHGWIKVGEITS